MLATYLGHILLEIYEVSRSLCLIMRQFIQEGGWYAQFVKILPQRARSLSQGSQAFGEPRPDDRK